MNRSAYYFSILLITLLCSSVPFALIWSQGETQETATITALRAPLHVEASAQSETIEMLPSGTLLTDLGLDDDLVWLQVETAEGVVGWVNAVYVRRNGPYVPPADGLTRNAIDGIAGDWDRFTRPFNDEVGDSTGTVDILAVRSFMNTEYLYLVVEIDGDARDAQLVLFDLVTLTDHVYRTYQYALPNRQVGTVFVVTEESGEARNAAEVLDARDTAIEFRMPLTLLDSPDMLNVVAVHVQEITDVGLSTTDELIEVMPTVVTLETDPVHNATAINARVNVRTAAVNGRILRVLAPETPVSLIGRNANSSWFLIRLDDAKLGWVAEQLIEPNAELVVDLLPVQE